jgi:hypothetical protein
VSYSKVRALTRVATAENEASLLEMARSSTASQLERICRGYRRAMRGLSDEPDNTGDDEASDRFVHLRDTDSGMVRIEAQLRPEEAALVIKALEAASSRAAGDISAETREPDSKGRLWLSRPDALVAVAETYLAGAADSAGAPIPVELVVHVDESALRHESSEAVATLEDGTLLAIETAERLACDASVVRVADDASGAPVTLGRRTRRISPSLRRSLRLRDGGCRFPSCTNRLTDAHHIVAWARGGVTRLSNLCLLCRRHHRFVHEHDYRIEARETGELSFIRPDGTVVPPAAALREPEADRFERLREMHVAEGLAIDRWTAYPRWDGHRVDYDHIVWCLAGQGDVSAPE